MLYDFSRQKKRAESRKVEQRRRSVTDNMCEKKYRTNKDASMNAGPNCKKKKKTEKRMDCDGREIGLSRRNMREE